MTPKYSHSHRQLFRYYCSSSVWRNNEIKLLKISVHSDLSPNLELSAQTELRHTTCLLEGTSPSVELMSRKEKIKDWPKPTSNTRTNHAKIAAYRINK